MDLKIIAIFVFIFVGCAVQHKHKTNTSTIETNELQTSNEIDFELIKAWVKDKRIVALGESTHGIGAFYSMKSEIVQFLHEELGYEVLAMEGGFADINLAWLDVDNMDAIELRNKTLFGNFICQEIKPLFEHLKENQNKESSLSYTGFDTQTSGDYYSNYLKAICTHLDLDLDVEKEFLAYIKIYQASFEPDSTNFIQYRNHYQNILKTLKQEVLENKNHLKEIMSLSDIELTIILRNLDLQYNAVNYHYAERFNAENMHAGIILRDQLMAQNIEWIIDALYPNKKIIIWAHNGHVGKSGINNYATKMMGEHLQDIYKDNYFSIGLFAYKGNTYQHWTKESIAFENSDSTSIENKMKRAHYKYSYQKFRNSDPNHWSNQEVTALEIENGGQVTFIPSKRFDAAINIYSGDIPRFERRK